LRSFGKAFLSAIVAHCRQKGLATDVAPPKGAPLALAATPAPAKNSPKKDAMFALFRKGKSVESVAASVELAPATVVEYLAEFVRTEKPESIFAWVPEDVCERVAAAADIHGTARMKPVFTELNGEVSYDHIRIVFAFLAAR
jgi:ATP-dependent DNA helicase RecQ